MQSPRRHAWGLADAAGHWIGLTLPHDEAQAMIAGRLQRISEVGDVHLVLAEVRVARSRFALVPIAVVARMPSVGKIRLLNLELETGGTELPSASMRADWLGLLARKPKSAPPVLARLATVVNGNATSGLLAECAEALLAIAELGTPRSGPERRARLSGAALRLEEGGLLPPADAMAAVADAGPGDLPAAPARRACSRPHAHLCASAPMVRPGGLSVVDRRGAEHLRRAIGAPPVYAKIVISRTVRGTRPRHAANTRYRLSPGLLGGIRSPSVYTGPWGEETSLVCWPASTATSNWFSPGLPTEGQRGRLES